jgi:GTPase
MPRAGFVTLAGKPNAGKSTLLNRLVGERLSITSPKPQSTRDRVVGILTRGTDARGGTPKATEQTDSVLASDPWPLASDAEPAQLIFLDSPGLLDPHDALQRAMRAAALKALADADVIVYLVDATEPPLPPPPLAQAAGLAAPPRAPVLLTLNKMDLVPADQRESLQAGVREAWPEALFISATSGDGIDTLLDSVTARLPVSPFLYPEEDVSTQSVRFFVTELIRETALEQLHQELPYSVVAQIEEFRETGSPVYIRAVIYVERDSQRRILLGHKGSRIRELGRSARLKIERLVGSAVYLDLWVKVLPNWRRDPDALRRFGYLPPGVRD